MMPPTRTPAASPSFLSLGAAISLSLALGACCGGSKDSGTTATKETTKETTKAEPAKPGQPATPTPKAPAAATDPAAMGPDGLPAEIPATRSAVPTLAEWNAVPREITVRRSTPLGCETKMVREWLRVSCRGKNNLGGTPLDVKKISGCGGDAFVFASGGVTSLVTPVLRGHTCDASFSWSIGGAQLWVRWPNGAPRPTIAFQD